ncbi:MAG: TRAP transporter large permease subunit [Geminicoccaceae bacterium]
MTFIELLPIFMFVVLGLLLFSGYPVAFVLGGIGLGFAVLGDMLGALNWARMTVLPNRIYGGTMENLVLVAIPMFIFMGTMLERSAPLATSCTRCRCADPPRGRGPSPSPSR